MDGQIDEVKEVNEHEQVEEEEGGARTMGPTQTPVQRRTKSARALGVGGAPKTGPIPEPAGGALASGPAQEAAIRGETTVGPQRELSGETHAEEGSETTGVAKTQPDPVAGKSGPSSEVATKHALIPDSFDESDASLVAALQDYSDIEFHNGVSGGKCQEAGLLRKAVTIGAEVGTERVTEIRPGAHPNLHRANENTFTQRVWLTGDGEDAPVFWKREF